MPMPLVRTMSRVDIQYEADTNASKPVRDYCKGWLEYLDSLDTYTADLVSRIAVGIGSNPGSPPPPPPGY